MIINYVLTRIFPDDRFIFTNQIIRNLLQFLQKIQPLL